MYVLTHLDIRHTSSVGEQIPRKFQDHNCIDISRQGGKDLGHEKLGTGKQLAMSDMVESKPGGPILRLPLEVGQNIASLLLSTDQLHLRLVNRCLKDWVVYRTGCKFGSVFSLPTIHECIEDLSNIEFRASLVSLTSCVLLNASLWQIPRAKICPLMDKASWHHSEKIVQMCRDAVLEFLPPYSPDFNPIEEFFLAY